MDDASDTGTVSFLCAVVVCLPCGKTMAEHSLETTKTLYVVHLCILPAFLIDTLDRSPDKAHLTRFFLGDALFCFSTKPLAS